MLTFDEVYKKIDEMQEEIIKYAVKIISIKSLSAEEEAAQKYIKQVLEELNFNKIDMWEPDIEEMKHHEAFNMKGEDFRGSPNVVGILKGTGGGKSLLFNSHIDIVPEGDLEEWSYQPYEGICDKGNIYGRGMSDMKGANAAIFGVIKAFKEMGIKLKGDIVFESVVQEETGGAGSLACALRGYKADAAIIPEPTDLIICPASQGSTWFRVIIPGKSGMGAKRYTGVSAIEKAYIVLNALQKLEKDRNDMYRSVLYKDNPIPFTVSVGTIQGGTWPGTVPGEVVIEGRYGISPDEDMKHGRQMFVDYVNEAADKDSWLKENKPKVEWFGPYWDSAKIDIDHPIVKTSVSAYKEVFGKEPSVKGTPYGTDAKAIAVYSNTPVINFGPGNCAHCPDEYTSIESLMGFAKTIAKIMLDWCGYEENKL